MNTKQSKEIELVQCISCEHYPNNCWDWDKNIRKDSRINHKTPYTEHCCNDYKDKN